MPSLAEIKKMPPKKMLRLIQQAKDYLKKDKVMQEMCKDYNFDINEIDLIPMKFGEIDVSATTNKGIITLNWKLLTDGDFFKDMSYIVHEIEHYINQINRPTQSADDGDYLSNKDEQSAFKRQVQWLDNQFGKEEAEDYVEQVLDHHDEKGNDRKEKKEILMEKVENINSLILLTKVANYFVRLADKTSDLKLKHPNHAEDIQVLSDEDPTSNKKYLNYAVKQLVSKQALKEEISDVVKLFHKFQHKLDNKDINSWNFTDLRDTLFKLRDTKSKRQEKSEIKTTGAEVVYEDDQCKVLLVKDKAAACFYGSGTKWCITMANESYFESYRNQNVVFFFVLRKDLPQDNPFYKVALAYERNIRNEIEALEIFDAADEKRAGLDAADRYILKNEDTILNLTKQIAETQSQPKSYKIIHGTVDPEEITNEDLDDFRTVKELFRRDFALKPEQIRYIFDKEMSKEPDDPTGINNFDHIMWNYKYTPSDILFEMINYINPNDLPSILHTKNMSSGLIEKIYHKYKNSDHFILDYIAMNKHTPMHILEELSNDYTYYVTQNINTPSEILKKIIVEKIYLLLTDIESIITHPNANKDVLNLLTTRYGNVIQGNQNLKQKIIEKLQQLGDE